MNGSGVSRMADMFLDTLLPDKTYININLIIMNSKSQNANNVGSCLQVLLLCLLLTVSKAQAQSSSLGASACSPQSFDILPPTPVSQNFIRYACHTPNLSTGTIDIPISLYDFKAGNLTLPISLRYATNGIKVYDNPLPVGYGWTLQPAFRVTRVVMGRADGSYCRYNGNYQNINPVDGKNVFYKRLVEDASAITDALDAQHDVFTACLPEESFRFIINWNSSLRKYVATTVGTDSRVIIEGYGGEVSGIKCIHITDTKGITYIYGNTGSASDIGPIEFSDTNVATAWGLDKIILPGKQGYLQFHWSGQQCNRTKPVYNDYCYFKDAFYDPDMPYLQAARAAYYPSGQFTEGEPMYINLYKIEYYIDCGVNATNYMLVSEVEYQYTSIRSEEMLTGIIVKDVSSNQIIKQINLKYISSNYLLSSLYISGEGTYSFDYNSHRSIETSKRSVGRDYWGFYNGKNNSAPQCPQTPVRSGSYMTYNFTMGESDMTPDEEYVQTNLLVRMTYPTGGRSEYVYEMQKFDGSSVSVFGNTIPALTAGGGVRIKEIIDTYAKDGQTISRRFEYGEGENGKGIAVAEPTIDTFFDMVAVHDYEEKTTGMTNHNDYRQFFLNSFSYYENFLVLGQPMIWYSEVSEYVEDTEKTTYYYSFDTYAKDRDIVGFENPVLMWRNVYTQASVEKKVPAFLCTISYPLLTLKVEYARPYSVYECVRETDYNYTKATSDFDELVVNRNIVEVGESNGGMFFYDSYGNIYFRYHFGLRPDGYSLPSNEVYSSILYELRLEKEYLKSEIVRTYKHADYTRGETNYEYVNGYRYNNTNITQKDVNLALKSKTADLSTTGCMKESYLYPWESLSDLTAQQKEHAGKLLENNLVDIPIRLQQSSDETFLAHKTVQYKSFAGGCVMPEMEYCKIGTGSEEARSNYDYDLYGNPVYVVEDGNNRTVYLWGYGGRYLIAEIKNISYDEAERAVNAVFGVSSIKELSSRMYTNSDKTILINNFKALRNHEALRESQVVSYTYIPMVGMDSVTDAAGKTTAYEYDSYGRLSGIIDSEGNVVESYSYNCINN